MVAVTPTRTRRSGLADPLRRTGAHRHLLAVRLVGGLPLLVIGLAHALLPDASMRPLVEAAGFPLPALLAPVSVAVEIIAGLALLLGWWARIGAALAVPTMLGALYTHVAIDVWPNGPENEPPLALPIAVLVAAMYVAWRGAGRWSFDRRAGHHA